MTRKINVNKQIEVVERSDGMPMMKFSCIDIDIDGTEHERDCYFAPFRGSFLRENVVKAACACYELPSGSSIYSNSNFNFLEKEIDDYFYDCFFETFLPEQGGRDRIEYCRDSFEKFMDFSNFMEILPEFTQAGINYISYLVEKDLLTEARKWRDPRIVEQISKLLKEALLSAQIYSESVNNRKE